MIGHEAEYSSLRAEILSEQANESNLLIAMYTISLAIFTFAIDKQNPFLFLVIIFVLIPFRLQIIWKQTGIIRLSAYIIVNFENGDSGFKWERTILDAVKYREKGFKHWFKIIAYSSNMASLMVILAVSFNFYYLKAGTYSLQIQVLDIVFATLGLLFVVFLDIKNSSKKQRLLYIEEFKKVNEADRVNLEQSQDIDNQL